MSEGAWSALRGPSRAGPVTTERSSGGSPIAVVRALGTHWAFTRAMAKRDLSEATKGAMLGITWLLLRPLVQAGAYIVIFGLILGPRLGDRSGRFEYALYVLSGTVVWQALQRVLEQAPGLVREKMEVVKQVIFPIETLPVSAALVSALGPAVGMGLFLVLAAFRGQLAWSAVLLPLPVALLALFAVGTSWVLMIVGVLLKDLREIVAVSVGLLTYLTPVVLTPEMVGPRAWRIVLLNPASHVIICFRDVLYGSFTPLSWLVFTTLALVAFAVGAAVVNRTKVLINEYI